ncbi:MAG: hypothetical protein ABIJ09_22865 [Pseudomonadota bacterium]
MTTIKSYSPRTGQRSTDALSGPGTDVKAAVPQPEITAPGVKPDIVSSSGQVEQAKLLGQVDAPVTATTPQTGARDLRATFDGLQTIGGGPAQARLLQDNLDSWNARWKMLESATMSIDTAYFSLEKDVFGFAFLGLLLNKQLEGVPVRVMTDAMADTFGQRGFKMPLRGKDYLQELANHGGQAYIFHPIWQRPLDLVRGDYSPLASNHDKTRSSTASMA